MFAIIRNDESVLSQPAPHGVAVWFSMAMTLATDWRYAVAFETRLGANKSALMHGATVHTIGEFDETARHREIGGGGVRRDGTGRSAPTGGGPVANRPARVATAGHPGAAEPRRDAGYSPARQPPHAAPDPHRVAAHDAPRAPVPEVGAGGRGRDARLAAYDEYAKL